MFEKFVVTWIDSIYLYYSIVKFYLTIALTTNRKDCMLKGFNFKLCISELCISVALLLFYSAKKGDTG